MSEANIAKYQQLATELEEKIIRHELKPGDKLPSIRLLASQFGFAKNTVIKALHDLEAKGLIQPKPKSGFIVRQLKQAQAPREPDFGDIKPAKVTIPDLLQDVLLRGAAFDIKPSEIPEPVPILLNKLHKQINRHLRSQTGRKALYYDEPLGYLPLRQQIAKHYAECGVQLSADQLAITAGCQHALFLALMATCKPGDNVAIESPGFYGVIQLLSQLGLNAIEVPSRSATGLDVSLLAEVLQQYSVSAIVVSPTFATPTGACMSEAAKNTLIELANQYDIALIEDDIYGDTVALPRTSPLKALDTENRVILCSSFSKSLSRDLRIGWVMGARWQQDIVKLKLVSNLASCQFIQQGLAEFLTAGDYKRYLIQRATVLEKQKQQWVNALHQHWGADAKFVVPEGGLSLWVELPEHVDTLALYFLAAKQNILITPGALFSVEQDFTNFIRLSFCHPLTAGREQALKQLRDLFAN